MTPLDVFRAREMGALKPGSRMAVPAIPTLGLALQILDRDLRMGPQLWWLIQQELARPWCSR